MTTDTTAAEENLMDWLRDAHAMEEQAETMLTSMPVGSTTIRI